jgi:3-methyl-2-oxobutanoate hydroxymethyltransferase
MMISTTCRDVRTISAPRARGNAVYCAANLDMIAKLAAKNVAVIGHLGLIPFRATWTGSFQAVGKTAKSAVAVNEPVKSSMK